MRITQRRDPRPHLLDGIRSRGLRPGQLGQLSDHDVDRRAEEEAGHDRSRQELRDPPHLEHCEEEEERSRDQGDTGNERRDVVDTGDACGQDGACGDRRQPRTGSRRYLTARPEDRIEDRPGGRRVETVLQRDPRDAGVAEVLRNDEGGHRDPGDEICPEPPTIVGTDPSDDGDEMRTSARRALVITSSHPRRTYRGYDCTASVPVGWAWPTRGVTA